MKNTLAMVQAVVTQSLRNATSLEAATHTVADRIQALGPAQDMLTETNWETTDIRDVVQAAIAPHTDGGNRFTVEGESVDLTAQQGMGLALAIHELATNAAKYGALSNASGNVEISWETGGDGNFSFRWSEVDGPTVAEHLTTGFGSRLVGRVVPTYFNGKATLDYASSGLTYIMIGSLS
ncbi:sensor histidine kinase [Aureimonas flava]|uniref:histidine kinase n=1 Tax=Aureimonas flava TaxID=2320271 RepID=A0A3A1WIP4_9HYPH|nr:sensor histidine kinase [Aureimonas flava]RIX98693.1 sensor histidine kinase [Aureimonas flava]